VVVAGIGRLPISLRGAAVFLLCTLAPGWYVVKAQAITVFAIHRAEQRYVAVGEAIGQRLEPNAVVLTVLHSGSVRLYGDRATVRWDLIEPDNLDFTLKALREGGWVPYLLLDEWEESVFRERFQRSRSCSRLGDDPLAVFTGATATRLYAFSAPSTQPE
jgi:hypothetical protein